VADAVTIGDRLHRGAGEHRAHRAPLVEENPDQPAEEEARARAPGDPATHGLGEVTSSPRLSPDPDQATQTPQVDQQDLGVALGAYGGEQEAGDRVGLGRAAPLEQQDHAPGQDPCEQREQDLPGGEGEEDRHQGRQQRQPSRIGPLHRAVG
jgi:hypothetical protein